MATYGILRVEKLKKLTNLKGSLMHAFREQDTPNADPARKGQNILLTPDANNVESTMAKYEQLKPKEGKIRSDVVHALEVLVTASPEKIRAMNTEERNAYFNDALRFCNAKFGEGNLLHAQIHNDETTAHLTAFYIPVIEKRKKNGEVSRRLNASSYLGGKKEFSARQSEFYEQVSKKYGMERGEIGSKATHKKVLDWYKELNAEQLGADFENVVGKLAKNEVTVEVEETQSKLIGGLVEGVLGQKHTPKMVEKQVKTTVPVVPLPSARDALRPYQNSNSEMKRREKEAWKKEARKELEEEVKAKLALKEAQLLEQEQKLKERENNANNIKSNVRQFYVTVASKLGVDIAGKSFPDTRKAIIDKAEQNGNAARQVEWLAEFKRNVDDEVESWTYTNSGGRVYSSFKEYKDAFKRSREEINNLTHKNDELNLKVLSADREKYSLVLLKSKISELVSDFFEDTLEKTVEKLVDIARKFYDPEFIKKRYNEQLQDKIDSNRDFLLGYFEYACDAQNPTSERIKKYNAAVAVLRDIVNYNNGRMPENINDVVDVFKKAEKEINDLANRQRLRM